MCLFLSCMFCGSTTTIIKKLISGTFLKVVQTCKSCLKKRFWLSQPQIGTVPLGNIRMLASILFSGSLPSKTFRMFEIFDINTITRVTFFRHQERHLQPAVHSVWTKQQQSIIHNLKEHENPIAVAGDERADSPWHSAKYGKYTLLELSCNKITDSQLVVVG